MPRRYASSRAVPKLRVHLGRRVRAMRRERDLSQVALGRKAGLSGKFIGEVERGDKSVSVDSLYRVATVLRIPLAALLLEMDPVGAGTANGRKRRSQREAASTLRTAGNR